MYDQEKKKSRGFGFLSFAEESACARAVSEHFVNIQNKQVNLRLNITIHLDILPYNIISNYVLLCLSMCS